MAIDGIKSLGIKPLSVPSINGVDEGNKVEGFKNMLSEAIDQVDNLQKHADDLRTKYAAGEVEDIHQVMTAIEEASIAMQYTVQIRNKVIEAYQEIMRMQI